MTALIRTLGDALLDRFVPRAVAAAACGGPCGCRRDPVDGEYVCWIRYDASSPCYPSGWSCYY
jgi:hypothetical protein